MKEMKNLTLKNNYFGEIEFESLTEEIKEYTLLLLMFVIIKHSSELKTRRYSNSSM